MLRCHTPVQQTWVLSAFAHASSPKHKQRVSLHWKIDCTISRRADAKVQSSKNHPQAAELHRPRTMYHATHMTLSQTSPDVCLGFCLKVGSEHRIPARSAHVHNAPVEGLATIPSGHHAWHARDDTKKRQNKKQQKEGNLSTMGLARLWTYGHVYIPPRMRRTLLNTCVMWKPNKPPPNSTRGVACIPEQNLAQTNN